MFMRQLKAIWEISVKVTLQDIVAVVAALDEWFTQNHEDRLIANEERLSTMQKGLRGIPNVEPKVVQLQRFWGAALHVVLDPTLGKTAEDVKTALDEGDPRIWVNTQGDNIVTINAHTLNKGDDEVVVRRLREVLTA
jgi:seryl-tRNA(Sec) selenium transferase